MTAAFIDEDDRKRLRTELDGSFFVEAGAGTGKTHALVGRIVELVASGRLRMEALAAITFTEAAAAELRDRIRQDLEGAAQDPDRDSEGHVRCASAAGEVDLASIQTIHAFAGALLRTYPLEAGLPPGFSTWDALQEREDFDDRFRAWLYDDFMIQSDLAEALRDIFTLEMKPDELRGIAEAIEARYDMFSSGQAWECPVVPDLVALAQYIGQQLIALEPLTIFARDPVNDPLVRELLQVQRPAHRLRDASDSESALQALFRFCEHPPKSVGAQKNWENGGRSVHPVKEIKDCFSATKGAAADAIATLRSAALCTLLGHLVAFSLKGAEDRRLRGVATFQDLLTWARNLLRDRPEVRERAQRQYTHQFVDEFQDTDPLQAEIVWFLASTPATCQETDWRKLSLQPGKLFLVGDPKQSIYRFRRADIRLYQEIYTERADGAALVSLRQNFRSVEAVITWVNHHFSRTITLTTGLQPEYATLESRPINGTPLHTDGVYTFGGASEEKSRERQRQEAREVAAIARRLVGADTWILPEGKTGSRRIRFDDICILLRGRTNLPALERAFQDAGVPYRMESGGLVLNTQEVRDLLSCLRAIDDPSDQVALVAALRSPAYACADTDLLTWADAGGLFNYLEPGDGCDGPVRRAFQSLQALHDRRGDLSAALLAEELIRERMLAVQAFGQERPREAWRRLRYVVNHARVLAANGKPGLRSLLIWLEGLQRERFYDPETALPESDEEAVRIMTIHGSKGLEFPVVILVGLGAGAPHANSIDVQIDPDGSTLHARCHEFKTPGYDGDRSRDADAAEAIRLLYVAATRAREYLFLSLHRGKSGAKSAAGVIDQHLLAGAPDLCQQMDTSVLAAPFSVPARALVDDNEVDWSRDGEARWLADRAALIAEHGSLRIETPSRLAGRARLISDKDALDEDDEPVIQEEPEIVQAVRSGRGGTALGRAVHATLETVDLETLDDLRVIAGQAGRQHGEPDSAEVIASFARAIAESDAVRRAIQANRYWREAPVTISVGTTILDGSIDLLYEHADGTLGIIDYKTDHLEPGTITARRGHYRVQMGAYALAVQQATGRIVSRVDVLFASQVDLSVSYAGEQIDAMIADARALVA